MMSDKEFAELELRAQICPGQCEWPKPEYVHWQKLHEAANDTRARVSKAYMQMDEIDRNADLSRDRKYGERSKIADEAIADFEGSKTLARARQTVELAVAKRNYEGHVSPEIAKDSEDMLKALKDVERGWQRAMDKIAERAGRTTVPNMQSNSFFTHERSGPYRRVTLGFSLGCVLKTAAPASVRDICFQMCF